MANLTTTLDLTHYDRNVITRFADAGGIAYTIKNDQMILDFGPNTFINQCMRSGFDAECVNWATYKQLKFLRELDPNINVFANIKEAQE